MTTRAIAVAESIDAVRLSMRELSTNESVRLLASFSEKVVLSCDAL